MLVITYFLSISNFVFMIISRGVKNNNNYYHINSLLVLLLLLF